jgi:hypothetical protein
MANLQKSLVAGVVIFLGMQGHRKSQLHASMYSPFAVHIVAMENLLLPWCAETPHHSTLARQGDNASQLLIWRGVIKA